MDSFSFGLLALAHGFPGNAPYPGDFCNSFHQKEDLGHLSFHPPEIRQAILSSRVSNPFFT